jgi:hypothetical protein
MKFQHLAIGARFEYEGKFYCKTGPISASSEQGESRMIPRHADLRPLDGGQEKETPKPGRKLDETIVLNAFEAFYAVCARQAEEHALIELAAARQRFLMELK